MAHIRINLLLRSLSFCFTLLIGLAASAQVDNVYVYGTVKDYNTSKKLDGITVNVLKDGVQYASVVTSANGKYEFNLDFGHEYKIVFGKVGMVGKNVSIDTKDIPEEQRVGGVAMNVEMTLFQDIPGIDYSILQKPIGKSKFDPATGTLAWDLAYTEQMRAELNRLQKEYDERKKREANADEAFNKLMEQGNAAMGAKDFKKAVQAFTDALGLKAGDPIATARLSDAKIKLGELEAAAQKEKQYADLIKEADVLFGKKTYEEAKAKYLAASQVKEQEAYPKQKVKECDTFIAELAAKAEADRKAKELNDKFNAAVAAGDAAFKAAKYEEARVKFTEAAGLKPDDKYPPQQLAAIAAKLDELAKKAEEEKKAKELEANYQAAIKAADAAFKGAKYEEARTKYNEALGIKPKEKYPTDQLAAIDKKLAELAAQAEAEKKAQELEASYQAAIKAADAAFKGAQYDEARTKYNEALAVKPKEKYPTDQLAAIDKKLTELAAKAEADKKAKELDAAYLAAIADADAAFRTEDFDNAKKKYNEALGLKPKEKYPADQLTAITKALADKAKKAEEERLAAERDAKFQALVDKAEELFGKEQYPESKAKFQEALVVKPGEARPKERIVEIDAKLAELARQAEAKRKQEELDARYATLIASADKQFDGKKYAEALNDYKDASQLKPTEPYPQERMAAINQLLDAKAKEQAEKERLEREKADKEKRYNEFIATADKEFKAKNYAAATSGYTSALEVKPGEKHPTDRLAEIEALLAAQAEADRLKAEQDAAERARLEEEARRKAEADSIKAAKEAAERARLEAEKRNKDQAAAELQSRYDDAVRSADAAFKERAWEAARHGYTEALGIKPGEKYPTTQLAAIDAAIAAERDAAAAADAQRLADEERRRKELADAEAAQAELERARQQREAQQALDARYAQVILDADKALADKDLAVARGLYAQALDIKPGETYPQLKIEQIDKLLEEQERLAREREQAQQQTAATPPPVVSVGNTDNRKAEEAEEFMREAREREEAEKYERIKRTRSAIAEQQEANAAKAEERHQGAAGQIAGYEEGNGKLYQGSEAMRLRNAEELEAMRQAWAGRKRDWKERGDQHSLDSWDQLDQVRTGIEEGRMARLERNEEAVARLNQSRDEHSSRMESVAEAAAARTEDARGQVDGQASALQALQQGRDAQLDHHRQQVELAKQNQETRQRQLMSRSIDKGAAEQERISNIPMNQQRSFSDYNRNELASQYPQGVTEESYTEGNKVIIRRVLVQGNKADLYSKVIAKWGTFYFKNGQSISEQIWTVNTGQ